MEDIKVTIGKNITKLRKKQNLTQNQLAEKLNYSDNAVSRWERGEVSPSIETLEQIAHVFNVPIANLLAEDAWEITTKYNKKQAYNRLAVILIFVSLVWLIATITFVYSKLIFNNIFWQVFIWAIPVSCLILLPFNKYWGRYIYQFVIFSVFQWSILLCVFLQFLQYNLWLIFIIGIPIQVGLCIWAFIKPKKYNENN